MPEGLGQAADPLAQHHYTPVRHGCSSMDQGSGRRWTAFLLLTLSGSSCDLLQTAMPVHSNRVLHHHAVVGAPGSKA